MILVFVFSWFFLHSSKSFISRAVFFQDTFEAFAALEDSEYVNTNFASVHVSSLLKLLEESEERSRSCLQDRLCFLHLSFFCIDSSAVLDLSWLLFNFAAIIFNFIIFRYLKIYDDILKISNDLSVCF